jgi:high-affinity nickel-transport protein
MPSLQGFVLVGLFVVVWAVAIGYWRLAWLEQCGTPAEGGTGPR